MCLQLEINNIERKEEQSGSSSALLGPTSEVLASLRQSCSWKQLSKHKASREHMHSFQRGLLLGVLQEVYAFFIKHVDNHSTFEDAMESYLLVAIRADWYPHTTGR